VPAPRTILNGVKKLPPATILTIEPDGRQSEHVYWDITVGPRGADRAMSEADWKDAVLESMRAAVERRRVADVPVGVLLSGGIDSSLIVALLAESGHKDLKTFSIGLRASATSKATSSNIPISSPSASAPTISRSASSPRA
jgi:asparagine synthase (glutamine-hydrolysing)